MQRLSGAERIALSIAVDGPHNGRPVPCWIGGAAWADDYISTADEMNFGFATYKLSHTRTHANLFSTWYQPNWSIVAVGRIDDGVSFIAQQQTMVGYVIQSGASDVYSGALHTLQPALRHFILKPRQLRMIASSALPTSWLDEVILLLAEFLPTALGFRKKELPVNVFAQADSTNPRVRVLKLPEGFYLHPLALIGVIMPAVNIAADTEVMQIILEGLEWYAPGAEVYGLDW